MRGTLQWQDKQQHAHSEKRTSWPAATPLKPVAILAAWLYVSCPGDLRAQGGVFMPSSGSEQAQLAARAMAASPDLEPEAGVDISRPHAARVFWPAAAPLKLSARHSFRLAALALLNPSVKATPVSQAICAVQFRSSEGEA